MESIGMEVDDGCWMRLPMCVHKVSIYTGTVLHLQQTIQGKKHNNNNNNN